MFFWKHKIISLLIIAAVAYVVVNPAHRFGIATANFTVFNRVPITGMDIFIDFEGSTKPMMKINGSDERREWMKSIQETPQEDDPMLLIVGTGFKKAVFQLGDSTVAMLDSRNIQTVQVPSDRAVKLYNDALGEKKKVALLLEIQK